MSFCLVISLSCCTIPFSLPLFILLFISINPSICLYRSVSLIIFVFMSFSVFLWYLSVCLSVSIIIFLSPCSYFHVSFCLHMPLLSFSLIYAVYASLFLSLYLPICTLYFTCVHTSITYVSSNFLLIHATFKS